MSVLYYAVLAFGAALALPSGGPDGVMDVSETGAQFVDVVVSFADPRPVLQETLSQASPSRTRLHEALTAHAAQHQAEVIAILEGSQAADHHATWTTLWIDNSLAIGHLDARLLPNIIAAPGVISIRPDTTVHLPDRVDEAPVEDNQWDTPESSSTPQGNIAELNVGPLWAKGHTGTGVTVATVDSGVRWTHEALAQNYRGYRGAGVPADHDYNFWTLEDVPLKPETADIYGHGTHVTGTLAGSGPYSIGMAPNATWIHAKAFGWDGTTKQSTLIQATQWTMCPTPRTQNKSTDCSKGADVVSGSFGGNSSLTWLNPTVTTLRAAGILAVFASGNVNAFKCGSVMEPAGFDASIAVGGEHDGLLYPSSGKGPGLDGKTVKPDFVAPSFAIRSALSAADTGREAYTRMTGTSMATPHVAGALALLLSASKLRAAASTGLEADKEAGEAALKALRSTAATKELKRPMLAPSSCGGTEWNVFPNNLYGWGLPDVCAGASSLGVHCPL